MFSYAACVRYLGSAKFVVPTIALDDATLSLAAAIFSKVSPDSDGRPVP